MQVNAGQKAWVLIYCIPNMELGWLEERRALVARLRQVLALFFTTTISGIPLIPYRPLPHRFLRLASIFSNTYVRRPVNHFGSSDILLRATIR